MSEKKFSKKHEWVSIEGDVATVGITKHATELLGDIKTAFDNYDIKTEILAASVRHPDHVKQAILLGVDAITIPYKVFKLMMDHPLTERGTKAFEKHAEI